MKKSWLAALILFFATGGALGCSNSSGSTEKTEVILSAAASLSTPLEQIKQDLEKANPDLRLTVNAGASGTLQKQIEQGAPADLFWSAAAKQMDDLEQKGLLLAGTRTNAAGNELVMITSRTKTGDLKDVHSFADLTQASVQKIAIGSPETVPAGTYGQQVLQKANVWEAVQGKLVFGKDVKQVLTYVERGDVDAGIVYRSDAQGSDQIEVLATAEAGSHAPIVYPVAVLKASKNPDAAKRVLAYLSGGQAGEVLARAGFTKGVK